ncbi:hypothetical protein Anas_09865, partial [Armadillidium nasatum]
SNLKVCVVNNLKKVIHKKEYWRKNKEVNKKLNFHNHKCETCDRTTSIQKEGSYNPLGDILERSYNPLGDILHS